jgi:hypothetical protein
MGAKPHQKGGGPQKETKNETLSSSSRHDAHSRGGGSGCERLVMDIDMSFVSRQMDIVLTLRSSDVRSVLPEATVTLSGILDIKIRIFIYDISSQTFKPPTPIFSFPNSYSSEVTATFSSMILASKPRLNTE